MSYETAAKMAARNIAKKGQRVTIRKQRNGTAEPGKPWREGVGTYEELTNIPVVFLGYELRFIDGEAIRAGDQRGLIAANSLSEPPDLRDLIVRGSEVWKIVNIGALNPGGIPIFYDLQLR